MEVQIFGVKQSSDTRAALRFFAERRIKTHFDERWLEKVALEPLLLRMPLVRHQQQLTIGAAEATWRAWVAAARESA
jgi:arsenate reductase